MTLRWFALLTSLVVTTAAAAAQQPGITTLQAHARAVLLDVVVTDGHGHAVHGLKAGDFDVIEDDEAQDIASFEEIRPRPLLASDAPKLPKNTYTNANDTNAASSYTVLLVDALDTALVNQSFAHGQVENYLKHAVLTGPVAIFSLGTQLRMIQGFTTDLGRLTEAVKQRDKLLQTAIPLSNGYVASRFRTDYLTTGLQQLGSYLAQFPGRKNLIWMTGSVPNYAYDDGTEYGGALHDAELFSYDYRKTTDLLTIGRISVYPLDAGGLRTNPAFSAARRGGAPSIDEISSFSVNESYKHQDLQEVADATGGRAFYNTNGLARAIAEVVETGANYYTLTYYPTNKNWDGKFRKLSVKLDRPGQLEYRRGYYAKVDTGPLPPAPGTAPPPPLPTTGRRQITHHDDPSIFERAMQLGAVDPGTIVFQARVDEKDGPLQAATDNFLEPKYRNKPFLWYEVQYTLSGKDLQLLPARDGTWKGAAEFVVLVLDDKGALVNSEQAVVQMNVQPETYAYLQQNGMQMPIRIAVPVKGNYFLRVGVHDQTSGKAGALEVAVGEIKP